MELNQSIENPLGAGTQAGQGEAFVFTPNQNVFSTIQNALNQDLALKQAELKRKEEEKKKQDAEYMKLLSELEVDSKWDRSLEEMSQHIDNVGDLVYKYRASGKPADVGFYTMLNKEKARQNSLKGMNEKTFNEVAKIEAEMLANEKIDPQEAELWRKGLDAQKTIEDRFNYVFKTPQPGEDFNTLKAFQDKMSEDVQKYNVTKTDPKKQAEAEKAIFNNLTAYEKMKTMKKYSQVAGRDLTEEEVLQAIHKDMEPWYTNKTASVSSYDRSGTNKTKNVVTASELGTSGGYADTVPIPTSGGTIQVVDNSGANIQIIPSKVQYTGKPGEGDNGRNTVGGWQVLGKKVGSTTTKTFTSKEEADAWISQNEGTIAQDASVDEKNVVTYKTLEDVAIPYDWNEAVINTAFPGLDVYGRAAKFNAAAGLGDPGYYRLPKQSSSESNRQQNQAASGGNAR